MTDSSPVTRLVEMVVPARLGTPFRWLIGSSWATNLGDGIALAAGPLLVASLTDEAFLVAFAALLGWAPWLVAGPVAGVLADRHDRRRIVVVANIARAAVLTGLIAAFIAGWVSIAGALVALALLAVAEVFADTTVETLMPMLIGRDDLGLANSRLQAGFIVLSQLAGPSVGALLFTAARTWPFATEVVLVVAGVLMVSRVTLPPAVPGPDGGETRPPRLGMRREMATALRWIWRNPAVRTLALTILLFNLTYGAAWSVLVLYSSERLGLGPVGFGLNITIMAVGGIVGTLLYGPLTRRVRLGDVLRVGLTIEALFHLGLALTTSPWVAGVLFFVLGVHAFIWGTASTTIRQRAVPIELQGRVGSVYRMCVFGALVVGAVIGGSLASWFGVTAPFWFAFVGSAVFVVVLWRPLLQVARDDDPTPARAGPGSAGPGDA